MGKIDYEYLSRIRRAAALYSKRKSSNLLEGDQMSMVHGRSLEFDDLREYLPGDDVNDIDWKSSSRTGKVLIRRYIATRRLNVMFVGDTGMKMTGDTPAGESKKEVALMTFGIAAYLCSRQEADFALSYSEPERDLISPFRSDPQHLESLLYGYRKGIESGEPRHTLYQTLERTVASTTKRMIIFIITDAEGLASFDERLLRLLVYRNDVCILKIEDAYLTTDDAYDLSRNRFEDSFMTGSSALHKAEVKMRRDMEKKALKLCTPHKVLFENISRQSEILDALIRLSDRVKETY